MKVGMSVSIRIRSCPSVSRLRRSLLFPDSYQRVAGDSWGTFDDCLTIQNRIKRYVSNLSSSILGGPRSRGRGRGVEPVQTESPCPPSCFFCSFARPTLAPSNRFPFVPTGGATGPLPLPQHLPPTIPYLWTLSILICSLAAALLQ